jgi:pilus assembly protein CpaE
VLAGYGVGADDYMAKPVELTILRAKIDTLLRRAAGEAAVKAAELGRVIVFMHGKGGVGATTLTTNTAIAISRRSPERVAILDLNLTFGNAELLLDVRNPRPLSELGQVTGEIDDETFDTFMSPHSSGVRLAVANRVAEHAELVSVPAVQLAIDRLRRRNDFVFVDLPANFSEQTLAAVDKAALICLVSTPRLAAMKATRECIEVLEKIRIPGDRVHLVLNQVRDPADLENATAFFRKAPDTIIHSSELFDRAADEGEPLVTKFAGSESRAEIDRLAERVAAALAEPARE